MSDLLARFKAQIVAATESDFRRDVTLGGNLVLAQAGNLTVTYAPFEHVVPGAKVVVVGITPGIRQAANALIEAGRLLRAGADTYAALAGAKVFASFSGPMRANLVSMLDAIGIARWIGVSSTQELWIPEKELVHFTSALRYPVLLNGGNYAGNPSMTRTPVLRRWLEECLREEAAALSQAVWVPLGPKACEGTSWLVSEGLVDPSRILDGLPHPSGANAERISYFLGRKPRSALSPKTNPLLLDAARERLTSMVAGLGDPLRSSS